MVLFVTDIDGTITHKMSHETGNNLQLIHNLLHAGVYVVMSSSKTFAEQYNLLHGAGLQMPFIFENGSAIAFPSGYTNLHASELRNGYEMIRLVPVNFEIQHCIHQLREKFSSAFTTISGGPERKLLEITGLQPEELLRARIREYSETIFFEEETKVDHAELSELLLAEEAVATKGSRFITITHKDATKGNAFAFLVELLRKQFDRIISVAAGDGPNDFPMLRLTDRAFYLTDEPNLPVGQLPQNVQIVASGPGGFSEVYSAIKEMIGQPV